jgi:hypothetical protein
MSDQNNQDQKEEITFIDPFEHLATIKPGLLQAMTKNRTAFMNLMTQIRQDMGDAYLVKNIVIGNQLEDVIEKEYPLLKDDDKSFEPKLTPEAQEIDNLITAHYLVGFLAFQLSFADELDHTFTHFLTKGNMDGTAFKILQDTIKH